MVTVITKAGSNSDIMSVNGPNGRRITMHSTPAEFDFEHVPDFGSIKREGKQEITRMTAYGLRTLTFTHIIANPDYRRSIEPTIIALQRLVQEGERVRFSGGSPFFTGAVWFNVLGFKISAQQLAGNNHISRATLTWTIKQAMDTTAFGKTAVSKSAPKKSTTKTVSKAVTRTHKVVKGDKLWNLAAKYLGNGARYPEIFRANKGSGKNNLKNPNDLRVGMTLKIPQK